MSTTPSSRKRKRGLSDARQSGSLSIELSSLPDTQIGPALGVCVVIFKLVPRFLPISLGSFFYPIASFPYVTLPKNTAFNISVREEEEGKEFVNCSSAITGETDTIEFSGSANDGSDGAGSRCELSGIPLQRCRTHHSSEDTSSHSIARDLRNSLCSPLQST